MRILVTGGDGFLGRRLIEALSQRKALSVGGHQPRPISQIISADLAHRNSTSSRNVSVVTVTGDLGNEEFCRSLIAEPFDVIFHLASLVSGGAEQNFEAGMRANLWATSELLERCRTQDKPAVFVFSSSIAAYGGDIAEVVGDDQALTPQTSYGTQKAACELLIHDYSRKGYVDGRSIRLPIVIIRPGEANTAVSGFASSLFREPLQDRIAQCPLADTDQIYIASAARSVDGLIRAAESPAESWGTFRAVTLPGRTASVQQMIEALRAFAGSEAVKRVIRKPDPLIQRIVHSWPSRFDSVRASRIGFAAELELTDIIEDFVRNELARERDDRLPRTPGISSATAH